MDLRRVMHVCKELAIKAGTEILDVYSQDFTVEYKQDNSPVTLADKNANDVIVKGLQLHFPQCAVLSEEAKDDKSRLHNPWCFIIDPLDGTKEFIKKNGEFTVNIALTYEHKPILGIIYAPVLKKLYCAAKGQGAFCENARGESKRLVVTDKTEQLIAVGSRSHGTVKLQKAYEGMGKITEIKSIGSSLKGCLIAEGFADIYYRDGYTMEWDTAAMQCIAEEAGALFRQLDDREMCYNRENTLNEKGFYIINRIENKLLL